MLVGRPQLLAEPSVGGHAANVSGGTLITRSIGIGAEIVDTDGVRALLIFIENFKYIYQHRSEF